MSISYRQATHQDAQQIKAVAIQAWQPFQNVLTPQHWLSLSANLQNDDTYLQLLNKSTCFVACSNQTMVGIAFLVPQGNPTNIYDAAWCYIRFVSVIPAFAGKGIGRQLTQLCMEHAKQNGETTIALHTSEIMGNARHIYESMGFTILKEIDQSLGKRYWLYTRQL